MTTTAQSTSALGLPEARGQCQFLAGVKGIPYQCGVVSGAGDDGLVA